MASGYVEWGIQLNCKCVSFHKRKSFKSKDMKMFSAFFSLSIMFIFGRLLPEEDLSKRKSGSVIEGTVLKSNLERQQRSSILGSNLSVCTVPPDRLSSQSWGIWLLKSCTRCWIAGDGQECFKVDGSWEGSTSGSSCFLILARQSLSSFSINVLLYSPLGAGCFITSSIRCSTFAWSSTRIYLENILFISSGSWQVETL